jgi:hypothetical protein
LALPEEAIEKNKVMRAVNYKDHISKVLETSMETHRRKFIKNNKEGKRRIQLIVKEANYGKIEIEKEQTHFQEIMGLYGEEAYSQQGINPITVMEIIFKMWEDIRRDRLKYFRENMCSEIEVSYLYDLLEEIKTRHEETIIE